ncbi:MULTISPECIES: type III-B CRISPR module-associated Cmr3 family protein [Kamptonema]|uniref:type III-B CRISPR module-associated Cmr3 family protein n=1 Tax=Kamptonema TaxID=1501433 RepID=UPI0001DACF18|nr:MULTISPECIES: type III-B CRISPR module-associated Cmr3 family protein [Kamptonema]CBN56404.1 conserved hypothetical protein [Kamptonema sp. PCC 6506]
MTGWYAITPLGPVAIGNLTPVGQNSGQVGCRWPPNGHQLAACLNLPTPKYELNCKPGCTLWGPFWYDGRDPYVILPLPVYTTDRSAIENGQVPEEIYRLQWRGNPGQEHWQVQAEHERSQEDGTVEIVGGRYLIGGNSLQDFWMRQESTSATLQKLPWETLTLSHNSRQDFLVKDEGGFFAEMTTLLAPGWSILVKVIGDWEPPPYSFLGAGSTPVVIEPVEGLMDEWLDGGYEDGKADYNDATGAILLTGALWQNKQRKESIPYPYTDRIKAYAAELGVPWQSWKKVKHSKDTERKVATLTPGEWMTPAGAVYLWEGKAPEGLRSQPLPNPYNHQDNRYLLGYGHLWLFKDKEFEG